MHTVISTRCKGCKGDGSRCTNNSAIDCQSGRCGNCCNDPSCSRHAFLLRPNHDSLNRHLAEPSFEPAENDETLTNETCTCGSPLGRKTEQDWFTGSDKVVFFCRRCRTRYTECAVKRMTLSRTPVEELLAQGQLDALTIERLKNFLQEKGLSTSGKKDDLLARAVQSLTQRGICLTDSLRDASNAVEIRIKEKNEKKACLQDTHVLSGIDCRKAAAPRHRCSANYFAQKHQVSLREAFGVGSPIARGELHHVKDSDVAIGLTGTSLRACIVVCSPRTGAIHALFEKLHAADVCQPLMDYFSYDSRRSHDYFRYDKGRQQLKTVHAEGVGQVPPKWTEVYSDGDIVTVLQREGFWSDMDWDFDKTFGKRHYYDPEPKGWGFTVSRKAWISAWEMLIEKVKQCRQKFAERDHRVSKGDVNTQAELEEFLSQCESTDPLLSRLSAWGVPAGTKLVMPGGRGTNPPRRLSDFTLLALKRMVQDNFEKRNAVTMSSPHEDSSGSEEQNSSSSDSESCDSGDDGCASSATKQTVQDHHKMASVEEIVKLLVAARKRGKQLEATNFLETCVQEQRPLQKLGGQHISSETLREALAQLATSCRSDVDESANLELPVPKRIKTGEAGCFSSAGA